MVFAVVVIVAAALGDLVLAAREARAPAEGGFLARFAVTSAILAALLPLGLVLPEPTLSHVAAVPSFDLLHPCLPPPHPPSRWHAVVPFALLRVALPAGVAVMIGARIVPRARLLFGASLALAAFVLATMVPRLFRGGVETQQISTCGALTPEQGWDGKTVRALLDRLHHDARQELVLFRDLPKLPPPPWVRGEIPVTIGGEPWSLRMRGVRTVAEPDDPRRANRPLAALHFQSIPAIEHGKTADGREAHVLVERRADGKWYAIRLGRALSFRELAPIARAPWWPVALLLTAFSGTLAFVGLSRRARGETLPFAPYRRAPSDPARVELLPAMAAVLLVETSLTALRVLGPYLG